MEEAILKLINELKRDRSVKLKMLGAVIVCAYLYQKSFKRIAKSLTVKVINDEECAKAYAYAKYYQTYNKALMKLFEDGVDDVSQEALNAYNAEIEFLDLMFNNDLD
jgi:hypothetical protein